MRDLPTWAVYVISGLGICVVFLAGISGSLLLNDRVVITKAFERVDKVVENQNILIKEMAASHEKQIAQIVVHNEKQNHVMEKICVALSMDYKTRMETFKNYPIMSK